MIPVRIAGTGSVLPGPAVSTEAIAARAYPGRDPAVLVQKTGIRTRHWAGPGDSHASLGAAALRRALDAAGLAPSDLERVIHVNCTGGDILLPATANRIGVELALAGSCDLVDLNNACAGFLSALDVGARCVATGMGPVGVVVSELWSRHLSPEEPRSYSVFGDAAAAVVLVPDTEGHGLLSSWLRNDGRVGGSVTLAHSGLTGVPEIVRFGVANQQIALEAVDAIVESARQALDRAGLAMDAIRWVLPHQPNGRMFDTLREQLGVTEERVVPVVQEIGSVGAASIPVSLDRLWRSARVAPGDHVLFLTVGSGIAYGGQVYRVGP